MFMHKLSVFLELYKFLAASTSFEQLFYRKKSLGAPVK